MSIRLESLVTQMIKDQRKVLTAIENLVTVSTAPAPVVSYAQGRVLVTAGTWTPDASVSSYTIRVQSVVGGQPTFTDSFGNITNLYDGETISYGNDYLLNNNVSILTVPSTSIVIVTYTKIV